MTDAERLKEMEEENKRLKEENVKLHQAVDRLNRIVNRLVSRYISVDQVDQTGKIA